MIVSEEHPVVFVHLLKTAGMSLFMSLCQQYRGGVADLYGVSVRNPESAAGPLKDHKIAAYCGHYFFGLHEWLDRPCYYFSIVRNPVDRIVSLHLFLSSYRKRMQATAQKRGISLERILTQERGADFFADFLPWLLGKHTLRTFLSCPSIEFDNGMVRRISGHGLDSAACTEQTLEKAKSNIERYFSVVGVQEQYPETLQLLRRTFDWPEMQEQRINESQEKAEFNAEARAFIAKMNELDNKLYDWVAERFERSKQQPPAPILVAPGNRTDAATPVLWRSVGEAPLRKSALTGQSVRTPRGHVITAPGVKPS